MNKLIVKFVMLFKPLFKSFNVNTDQLATILLVKLLMDERRPTALMAGKRQQTKTKAGSPWFTMLMMAIMGLVLTTTLFLNPQPLVGQAVYFTVFMVLISLTLIADFTSVLIDVRDNYIILPRPVNDATVTVSRILHISIHISKMVLSLTLPTVVLLAFVNGGVAVAAFIIEVFSATMLTIFLVNMVYLVVLKVSSPQKFKDFISYFQIIFSVMIFAGYQLLPRLMQSEVFKSIDLLSYKISYFLPPVWFASFYETLVHPDTFSALQLTLAVLGIVMPFATLILVIKVLAPGFNRKLSAISGSGDDPVAKKDSSQKGETVYGKGIAYKLAAFGTTNKAEQAGFLLTWWLSGRYRDFKVTVYPAFAYMPVYFAYLLFSGKRGFSAATLQDSLGYIILGYLTSFLILTVMQRMVFAEKYKSAWVMFSTPHNQPGKIMAGMFKAIIAKFYIPYYLLISIFSIVTWGPAVINDLLFAFFNVLTLAVLIALFVVRSLPFSQPVSNQQGGRVIVNLVIMGFIGALGFVHYFISSWEILVWVMMLFSAMIFSLLYYYFQKRDWTAMEADYD